MPSRFKQLQQQARNLGCSADKIKCCKLLQDLEQLVLESRAPAVDVTSPATVEPPPPEAAETAAAGEAPDAGTRAHDSYFPSPFVCAASVGAYKRLRKSSSVVVCVRGLHFRAAEQDLQEFFSGYQVYCCYQPSSQQLPRQVVPDSVHIELHADGRPTGTARVSFVSETEARRAVHDKHEQMLGPRYVQLGLQHQYCSPQSNTTKLPALLSRHWRTRERVEGVEAGTHPFTVMSWNVLAAGLGDDQFRDRADDVCWGYRSVLLLQEIERADADIVCLCEENFHDRFWLPQMLARGYDGCVRAEKSSSPCRHFFPKDESDINDGSAIFFRTERFELKDDFSRPLQSDGGKVAAIGVLLDKQANRAICIAMTHLTMGGNRASKRAAEMGSLLDTLSKATLSKAARAAAGATGVLLCGDWNESPGGAVEGLVRSTKVAKFESAYRDCVPLFTAQDFASTWCSGVEWPAIEGIPHGAYQDMIDYMYLSRTSLRVQSTWTELAFGDTVEHNGIPNGYYPSDHVALACRLGWNQNVDGDLCDSADNAEVEDDNEWACEECGCTYGNEQDAESCEAKCLALKRQQRKIKKNRK